MTTVTQAVADRDRQPQPSSGTPSASLAIRADQDFWTAKQIAALGVLGLSKASNADLAVFMHYCQKTGLDPFSRQIYGIMRREKQGDQWVDKFTIQVGIDGFRVIRDRVARRLGVTVEYQDTRWYDADGITYEVWLSDEPPAACSLAVYRDGMRFPAVVRWSAFAQVNKDGKPTSMWARMGAEQLEKCAEAKALRRAFPHDLGGVYLEEEMPAQEPPRRTRARQTVTARAEVIETPGPAVPDETPVSGPAAGPGTTRPSKAAGDRLEKLLARLPLGDEHDTAVMLAWIAGKPVDVEYTAADVRTVTSVLEDELSQAGGDTEETVSRLWGKYRAANPQAGDEGA